MTSLRHITLNSGYVRESCPDEVSTEMLEAKQEIGRERIARMEQGLPADAPPPPPVSAAAPMVAGLAAGADAHIVKKNLTRLELVSTISQLL